MCSIVRTAVCLAAWISLSLGSGAYAEDANPGKTVYDGRCAFCHGVAGKGDGPAGAALRPPPTNFTSADGWKHLTPRAMKDVIENGKPGTAMIAFKTSLTAAQVDALIAYLDTFKPTP